MLLRVFVLGGGRADGVRLCWEQGLIALGKVGVE